MLNTIAFLLMELQDYSWGKMYELNLHSYV